jgi:hypothetical protein
MSTPGAMYEPCEECGAPLDPQQRYCVNCAARRGNGTNPSSRYFAAMSKRARRPAARPSGKSGSNSRAAAVGFFALLPIAVAIGVVVGRADSGGGDEQALLQALREQNQSAAVGGTTPGDTADAKAKAAKSKQAKQNSGKPHEKIAAKTKNGVVHQVTGFKATPKVEKEDTELVENNVKQTGSTYIEAQQNLPDVIPVGGSGEATTAPKGGAEP